MNGPARAIEEIGCGRRGEEGKESGDCHASIIPGLGTGIVERKDPSEDVLTTEVLGSALLVEAGWGLDCGVGGALELAPAVPSGGLLSATYPKSPLSESPQFSGPYPGQTCPHSLTETVSAGT